MGNANCENSHVDHRWLSFQGSEEEVPHLHRIQQSVRHNREEKLLQQLMLQGIKLPKNSTVDESIVVATRRGHSGIQTTSPG